MTARSFVDTNVWVYAVDTADPAKRARALEVLAATPESDYVISAQVIGEFYTTVTSKLRNAVPAADGRAMVQQMSLLPVVPLDLALASAAIAGSEQWKISYWDALIVAAASSAGCRLLLSEDLSDGAVYDSVRVENPFRDPATRTGEPI